MSTAFSGVLCLKLMVGFLAEPTKPTLDDKDNVPSHGRITLVNLNDRCEHTRSLTGASPAPHFTREYGS